MTDDPFDSEEQALIERLQRAPQPHLTPRAFDNIRARVLEGVRPAPVPTFRLRRWTLGLVAASFIVITFAVVVLVNKPRPQPDSVALLGTLTPTEVVAATRTQEPPTVVPVQVTIVTTVPPASPSATEKPPLITNSPFPTASPTIPEASPTNIPAAIIVVEGRIQSITANQVKVYDISIQVAPENPILRILKVGDFIRVTGSLSSGGQLNAVQVSNIIDQPSNGATVLIDGRVQAVQNNIVTINGIDVQLVPNDPNLKAIQVGTFLSITGNFEQQSATTLLVAVTVKIVNDADVVNYLHCKNLKAMGMGDGGMGMGDDGMGMGMGMGDSGMGMGVDNCP